MKHTAELSYNELKEAIREYLLKRGYCLDALMYGTPLKFILGKLEVTLNHGEKFTKIERK